MDALLLTIKLSAAVRAGDLAAINTLIARLEQLLSAEDLLVVLEGVLGQFPPEPPLVTATCA